MTIDPDRLVPGGALLGPVFARLARGHDDSDSELPPSAAFGPFRAVRELGRGGMAAVWLGERVDGGFEQQVALKIVGVHGDTAGLQALFLRERQLLARLVHPNIARLLDGGQLDDGRLWFAMDLVDGQRIDRWCHDRGLPVDARLALFRQVCDAVAFAHARLAIHRDIKPSNIMVSGEGQVKLLDFGIAALLDPAGAAIAPTPALTPGFASPEQVRGETATTASDIWQLGRLLSVLSSDDSDGNAHVRESATPLAAPVLVAPTGLVRPADRDLAAIIARATAGNPDHRYGTVAELIGDLDRRSQRQPVLARHGGVRYRLGRFLSRRRWPVAGFALALVTLATVSIVFTVGLSRERDTAERAAERSAAALAFLTDMFQVADPAVNRGERLSANEILDRGARTLETALADQPDVRASLLMTIGRVHLGLGQSAQAESLLLQSVGLTRSLREHDPLALATRLRLLAQVQWRLGKLAEARTSSEEGLDLLVDPGANPDLYARLLNTRAIVTLLLGDARAAERMQRDALASIGATLGAGSEQAGYGWNNLGRILSEQQRNADAAAAFVTAVAILESTLGTDHPDTLDIATSRARQTGFSGNIEAALTDLAATQTAMLRVLGDGDWRYGFTQLSEAEIRLHAGQADAALAPAQRGLKIYRTSAGKNNLYTAVAWEVLGRVHAALGQHDQALAAFGDSLRIREAQLADGHPDLALSRDYVIRERCAQGGRRDGENARAAAASGSPAVPMSASDRMPCPSQP